MAEAVTGNVFIISAASGTGKTTLVSRLLAKYPDIRVSVSHTTRAPREGEVNGQHYHFVDADTFRTLIAENAFLEHAEVFGNYYGTSIRGVEALCAQGVDVILEIDVQGAEQVRRRLPDSTSVFILPPSMQHLESRLRNRNTDSDEVIARRLGEAAQEIAQAPGFDYLVVNEDLDAAEAELYHIIRAQRNRRSKQRDFVEKLLQNP